MTPKQRTAVNLLAAGRNDREVAERVGVRRETICAWRHDPAFAAQLESCRRELWSPYVERLLSLIPRAFEVIEWQAHAEKDLKLAFKLLELVGLDSACRSAPAPPGLHPPVVESQSFKDHLALRNEFEQITGVDPLTLGRPDSQLAQQWMRYLENREIGLVGEAILKAAEAEVATYSAAESVNPAGPEPEGLRVVPN